MHQAGRAGGQRGLCLEPWEGVAGQLAEVPCWGGLRTEKLVIAEPLLSQTWLRALGAC